MSAFHFSSRSAKARWAALLLALVLPLATLQAQRQSAPKRELTEKVSEQLAKYSEMVNNKDYAGALKLVDDLSKGVQAESYDAIVLAQAKAQALLQNNQYGAAIPPLENAIRLGEAYDFLDARQLQEYLLLLSQLHYQEAANLKEPAQQVPGMDRALTYLRRYLQRTEKPNPESRLYAAHLFYSRATIDPENVDMTLLEESKKQAESGLYSAIKPRDTFYVLLLAVLQQQGRNREVADLLELLVQHQPTNRQYWQQLAFTYLALAEEEKDNPQAVYEWNVRTILAIERAQELGIMDTPRDHFNLVGIYFNIQRFDQAVELLEKGLNNGNIENIQRNWELLASSYQQIRKELKAIDVLKEATKRFPEAGQLEFTIAQTYYQLDKLEDAYRHATEALRKGNLDRRTPVLLFTAYVAYELKRYEDARRFAEEANQDPNADGADRLLRAINEAIQEREQALKAKVF
jgi:hypothetical protein